MKPIEKAIRTFIVSAGILLVAAGVVRFMVAATDSQILALPDPVLGIRIRYAVVGVGVAEFVVGLVCIFGKAVGARTSLLAWLMTNWAVYWAALFYEKISIRCTCLGILTDPLRLSHTLPGRVMEFLPFCLLAGAYIVTVAVWIGQRQPRRNFLKVVCPGCGGHIEFPAEVLGWKIACPHCGGGVHLQNLPRIA